MALKSPLLIIIIPLFFIPLFSHPPLGMLMDEKKRLGSTPPSCYNKCNECHPCKAVKVAIYPSHDRVKPSTSSVAIPEFDSFSGDDNKYSEYKPLSWRCSCKDHLYNP